MPWPGKERPSEHYQEDLAAILTDRMPAHLGPVAARAIAAFILTTVGATISEATRLRGAAHRPRRSPAPSPTPSGALDILDTGIGDVAGLKSGTHATQATR